MFVELFLIRHHNDCNNNNNDEPFQPFLFKQRVQKNAYSIEQNLVNLLQEKHFIYRSNKTNYTAKKQKKIRFKLHVN